jgi:hypothetical protein
MENKFGLNIDFYPNDCISFLEDVGILTKTLEGIWELETRLSKAYLCYFATS